MLVIATLPAIALWIGMNFMPESPRWLASMGSFGETLSVLQRIRSQSEARAEFEEVKAMAVEDYKSKMGSWQDLGVPWLRRIFVVGIGLAVIQQITGVNSIMYYGTQILAESGFGREAALTANIANGIISVVATFVGIWLLGKVGRRKMLITGQIGTTAALLLIGVFSLVLPEGTARGFVILALTVTFLAFQQGAISPVTWLMLSEIFPLKIRGLGMGASAFVLWTVNFLVGSASRSSSPRSGSPTRSSSSPCWVSAPSRLPRTTSRKQRTRAWKTWSTTSSNWLPNNPSPRSLAGESERGRRGFKRLRVRVQLRERIDQGASSGTSCASASARSSVASWLGRASSSSLMPPGVSSV